MPLPNLVCVGMEKCGTTLLNSVFSESRDILTPRKKELFYFNENYDRGADWYQSWYDFDSKPNARYICDITPSYFRSELSIRRICKDLDNPKVLLVLRHPVHRAFSHYVHRIRHIALNLDAYGKSFYDELKERAKNPLLFPRYDRVVERMLQYVDRDRLLILVYESDFLDFEQLNAKICSFLDISDLDFGAFKGRQVNKGLMPGIYYGDRKSASSEIELEGETLQVPPNHLLLAHAKGTETWDRVDPQTARDNVAAASRWTRTLSATDVESIYEEYFSEEIERLCQLTGLDLDAWGMLRDGVAYERALPPAQYLTRQG
ncbi:sulfotransferase family protein [Parahaliea aestuarii]|nr:sulfotransferase [Parahaliea aestuarii]